MRPFHSTSSYPLASPVPTGAISFAAARVSALSVAVLNVVRRPRVVLSLAMATVSTWCSPSSAATAHMFTGGSRSGGSNATGSGAGRSGTLGSATAGSYAMRSGAGGSYTGGSCRGSGAGGSGSSTDAVSQTGSASQAGASYAGPSHHASSQQSSSSHQPAAGCATRTRPSAMAA